MRRVEIFFDGKMCSGEELEWDLLEGESWSKFRMADGHTVKIKTCLTRAVRLDERDDSGAPKVVVFTHNVVIAHCPPHLLTADDIRPARPETAPPPPQSGDTQGEKS